MNQRSMRIRSALISSAALLSINVYFSVTGTQYWEMIDSLRVILEESTDNENREAVKPYHYTDHSSMMGCDNIRHNGSVSYQGAAGRYYRAYVTIWAGNSSGGDTRYVWSYSKQAT